MIDSISKLKVNTKILINIIFIALGVLLPQMFHLFGATGTIFLPMHIPVILAGITLGPVYGLISGIFSPVVSTFLTGMPILICQLAVCGLVSGILSKYTKLPSILLVLITQVSGFISYLVAYSAIKSLFLPTIQTSISAVNAYITGIPGIILQLVLITGVLVLAKRKDKLNDQSSKRTNI